MKAARKTLQRFNNMKGTLMGVPFVVLSLVLQGCNPTELQSAGVRSNPDVVNASLVGKAYVYEDDPFNTTGNPNLSPLYNIGKIVGSTPKQITDPSKTTLTADCLFKQQNYFFGESSTSFVDCIRVLSSESPSVVPLQPNSGNWIYPAGTTEFYQVQAMYHTNKFMERMFGAMSFIQEKLHTDGLKSLPPAVPYDMSTTGTWWFKYLTSKSQMTKTAQLTVYSTITDESLQDNASYDPVINAVRMGWTKYNGFKEGSPKSVLMIQDPAILYHELGHAFMTLFLNMRNAEQVGMTWEPLKYQAFPYYGSYSELGAMGEGIADYFSYAMNGRASFGDWAFGKFTYGRRPLTEDHPLHAPGISSAVDERVSYPDFLHYEPGRPELAFEDVHNGGMFTSHYLIALTDSLKTECFWDHDTAVNHVMLTMAESFSFLGDLTGRGTDYNNTNDGTGKPKPIVNLHRNASYDWYYSVRPITTRRWAQAMARNIYHHITRDACPNFTKEKSEKLMDIYGILLFRHYDDNGTFSSSYSDSTSRQDSFAITSPSGIRNSTISGIFASLFGGYYPNAITGNRAAPTTVDEINRIKSVLIPKASLDFQDDGAYASLFINDTQSFGQSVVANVLFQGKIISPSVGTAGPEYNNNNKRISPGELLGVGIDLVNRSNTSIGGVTILGTPWAHMKVTNAATGKSQPCTINGFPSSSEGGLTCADSDILPTDGARFKKPTSGNYPSKALHPVCLVQMNSNNETKWVSQDEFRKNVLQLEDKDCLGYGTPDFTPAECLARFVPGMEMAYYSKIAPQKKYTDTIFDPFDTYNSSVPPEEQIQAPLLSSSTVMLLEMNKWIPPGTSFTCRLRAQFSNCSDCFESAPGQDEYTDLEYGGHKPFKVLDVNFVVLQ